jgi:beta-galactosidase
MMRRAALLTLLLALASPFLPRLTAREAVPGILPSSIEIIPDLFLVDGQPLQLRAAEIHITHLPREHWRHRLQLCKALGLNAVSLCLLWNEHETAPGRFHWTDDHDAAAFCRLARDEGLWVILRPGPYSCPSSHRGGLPVWLMGKNDRSLRSRNPAFLDPACRWLRETGRVLAPLQASQGGPIVMAEVEQEYGTFGNDPDYPGLLREALLDAGFTVPLVASNRPEHLGNALRRDLLLAVNCDQDPSVALARLRQIQPSGPLFCGLYLPGLFSGPPARLPQDGVARFLGDLELLLKQNVSFQLLESCGPSAPEPPPSGTAGESFVCPPPFDEAGRPTATFRKWRALVAKYNPQADALPDAPQPLPLIAFPPVTLMECVPLADYLPSLHEAAQPPSFEQAGLDQGAALYRAHLPPGPAARLRLPPVRDAALLQLNGTLAAQWNLHQSPPVVDLPARTVRTAIDIVVHAGPGGGDFRTSHGLLGSPILQGPGGNHTVTPWQMQPFETPPALLAYQPADSITGPAFWRGTILLKQTGETFLDPGDGTGRIWINGRCIGDFGLPGCPRLLHVCGPWLRSGENEIVLLNLRGGAKPAVQGRREPASP